MTTTVAIDDSSTSKNTTSNGSLEASRFDAEISPYHVAVEEAIDSKHKASTASGHANLDDGSQALRVTLSVGGMTCSSCTGTITTLVSDLQGVSDVAVSLLSNSATVIVDHMKFVDIVVETVKDSGYEAEVISVEPLSVLDHDSTNNPRTIALRIDGMFCR
jgi:P-type Cu+ transporter